MEGARGPTCSGKSSGGILPKLVVQALSRRLCREKLVTNSVAVAMHPTMTSSSSWQGRLAVQYVHRDGHTHQRLTQVQAPLKLQRPFYPEGKHRCHGVVLHTAGGLVAGDRLELSARLEPGAEALLTTVAATKIYGPGRLTQGLEASWSLTGAQGNGSEKSESRAQETLGSPSATREPGEAIATSQQIIHWQLGAEAHGEWLPLETIAYGSAHHRQTVRVELAEGATWLGWDLVRLGRSAGGETFGSGAWRSQTEIWQGGRPVWIDPLWIPGEPELLQSAQGLAGQPVMGTLAWVGLAVERETVEQARQLWLEARAVPQPDRTGTKGQTIAAEAQVGVTRLERGLLCRYRGHSTQEARAWFQLVWAVVRSLRGADRPVAPRVWP